MRRTAVINQIRGLRLERGITVRQGRGHIDAALPGILEDASAAQLSGALRVLRVQLKLELDHLQMRIDEADAMINKAAGENQACRRLVAIPGIGPVMATAIIAAIGNGAAFKKGRGFSAWLGIVPGEYTPGGKQKLLGISKRGNSYLRRLFVQGARAVRQQSAKQSSGLRTWPAQLTTRAHTIHSGLPSTRSESVERDAQRREFDSLYAAASNGWSFAPLIKSHKIVAGSPSVSGMFAIRPTRFA